MQESIYVPIILGAFVVLLRALLKEDAATPWDYGLAGAVFGLATLTRSMPMYVLPLFAVLMFWRDRRRGVWNAAAMLAGFLLLTIPYSAALSQHLGRATFVENHGSIFIVQRYGGLEGGEPATLVQTAAILIGGFVDTPRATLNDWWRTTKSVFHVNGGRLLQIYLGAATKTGAIASKLATHVFADAAFIVCLVLAPLGFVLCNRSMPATFLIVWIVINMGLIALSGFGGPRLRAPFEPHLIALAAVVAAGGFRKAGVTVVALAGLVSAVLAYIVVPQMPASLAARADYGVHWPLRIPPKRSPMTGEAGFNVLVIDETVRFYVRPRNPGGRTDVEVRLDGETVETVRLTDREHRFELPRAGGGLAHVELVATDPKTGEPLRLLVIVPRVT